MSASVISAAKWSFLERFSTQIVGFFVGIVLARLLTPADFGIVGITAVFLAISNVFIDSGFGNALIRKNDRSNIDCSTAFFFNIFVGAVCFIILCVLSPLIALFFNEPLLSTLLRIAGLNVILNSLCVVQMAILTSQLDIKKLTIVNFCAQLPAGCFAIFLARKGFGVYSLVIQTVAASTVKTILLWYTTKWKPQRIFSKESFHYLWNFGSKLLVANLIGTLFNQSYSILIGKYIGKNELGYFSKSSQLNTQMDSICSGIVQKIALPVLARYQTDLSELSKNFRVSMRALIALMAPIVAFVFFESDQIVTLLWSSKWIESSYLLKYLVLGTLFNPLGQLCLSLMQVVGRTDLLLKLEIPKKTIYCIYIAIGFQYDVKGIVIAYVFIQLTGTIINMLATKKIVTYSFINQILDLTKYVIIACLTAYCTSLVIRINFPLLHLVSFGFLQCLFYFLILYVSRDKIINVIFSKIRKKN